MTVISIHPILTGPAIKTRVTLTVIDDGIARFAWVHRTTQIKMDEVGDNTGKPRGEHSSLPPTGRGLQAFITTHCKQRKNLGPTNHSKFQRLFETIVKYIIWRCDVICFAAVLTYSKKMFWHKWRCCGIETARPRWKNLIQNILKPSWPHSTGRNVSH